MQFTTYEQLKKVSFSKMFRLDVFVLAVFELLAQLNLMDSLLLRLMRGLTSFTSLIASLLLPSNCNEWVLTWRDGVTVDDTAWKERTGYPETIGCRGTGGDHLSV